ncbi:MAG: site-2 protease family protein [Planctomycetaceae bacterium]
MFGLAGETEFDLRFYLFGIPVRVHPMFWLSSAWMVWAGENFDLTAIGILCIFLSVLVHELGHAWFIRKFGYPSEIVLFFFCGYATSSHFPFWRRIIVSAAGPAVGLILGIFCYLLFRFLPPNIILGYSHIRYFLYMMMFAGIIVNILNLIPCLPLDGGQIMGALVKQYGPPGRVNQELIYKISIAVSGAVAVWAAVCLNQEQLFFPRWLFAWLPERDAILLYTLQPSPKFEMIFMGYLCASNINALNQYRLWR